MIFRCRGQFDHRFADQLARFDAEHLRGRPVGGDNAQPDGIDQPNGFDHTFEQRLPAAVVHGLCSPPDRLLARSKK